MDPRLLRLYEGELRFMRDMGAEFAAEFPKVAARLGLGRLEVADPYVERLLEGFAFLTARVQLQHGGGVPDLHAVAAADGVPALPGAHAVHGGGALRSRTRRCRRRPEGALLPAGTELRCLLGTEDQTNCEFRTAHPVQLLPIELAEAEYIGSPAAVAALGLPDRRGVKAAIRLRLRTRGACRSPGCRSTASSLFLGGPEGARLRLYEQLVANVLQVHVRPSVRPLPWQESLPPSSVRALGFEPEEALLPRAPQSFDGYRLLQEYHAMPERFLFVAFDGLDRAAARCATGELELVVLLDRADPLLAAGFGVEQMLLFCTPAINLFPRRGDRINLAEREAEHLVVPDRMRPLDFEVFGVRAVEGFAAEGSLRSRSCRSTPPTTCSRTPGTARTTRCAGSRGSSPPARASAGRARPTSGHDVFISLVDAEQAPYGPGLRQLGLDLLCTNRDLPLAMPVGRQHTDFTLVVGAPVASVRCVVGPVAPRPCRGEGELRLALHLPPRAELPEPVRHRQRHRRRRPARAAAALRAGRGLGGGAAARGAAVRVLAPGGAAHPGRGPRGGGARARGHADDGRGGVRRRRRRAARRGAGAVPRQVRLHQRLHRDHAALHRARRAHALAAAARAAARAVRVWFSFPGKEEGKRFFFEKKKQKTFAGLARNALGVRCKTGQSLFASFSSEKEDSFFLPRGLLA